MCCSIIVQARKVFFIRTLKRGNFFTNNFIKNHDHIFIKETYDYPCNIVNTNGKNFKRAVFLKFLQNPNFLLKKKRINF